MEIREEVLTRRKVWLGTDTIAEIVKRVADGKVVVRFNDGIEEEVSVTSIERTSR